MKILKLSLIIILAGVLLSGCKEKKSVVEIVPNLDSIYLSQFQVDSFPKLENGLGKKDAKDFKEALISIIGSKPNIPVVYKIAVRFYIDENGMINKIKDIGSSISYYDSSSSIINQQKIENLMEVMASTVSNWKFRPAIKNGKPVKCWMDNILYYTINPDGSTNLKFGEVPSPIPGINEFVQVDQLPQVVNSIMPHYPELAKRAGVEGKAWVKILVGPSGIPLNAIVIKSSDPIFNQTSIDAAMRFKFSPALKDNKPVAVWVVVPFKYTLDGSKGELKQHKDLKKMPTPKDSN
jgi:TonB family protein